jgi:isocitrate dehydrogenase
MDNTPDLAAFAAKLEKATLAAIEEGDMTGDLARIARPAPAKILNSWEFVNAIAGRISL